MFYYIDPGTGSMLFTVLIGVLSAAIYFMRDALVKLRFLFSGGKREKTAAAREPFVLFTDSKRYWTIFKPICDEMDRRGQQVLYLTASPDDPMLNEKWRHVRAEYAGAGNKAYARMNMLKADVVLSSTPGLDVFQWKRSRDVKWYAHVLHAANDVTGYCMFGLDYFDALLLSGEYQIREVRQLEALRGLPEKEIRLVGLPHMDALLRRLREAPPMGPHPTTVLLAPSWGKTAVFSRYGGRIIDALLKTDYHIIIRPHPQSFESETELIDGLMRAYPDSDRLEWNRDTDNFDALHRADLLISDFSGVIFDFSLVFGKPILYADVSFDDAPYDAWWLKEKKWTFGILDKLGMQLTPENLDRIGEVIDHCLRAPEYREGIERAKNETWANIGHSVESIADYLMEARERLLTAEASPAPRKKDARPA